MRKCLSCCLFLISACLLNGVAHPRDSVVKANSREEVVPSAFRWQGSVSCASAACHNHNQLKQIKGSEYTVWKTLDRHSRAFAVLYDKRSEQIEKNLSRGGPAAPAWQDRLCLHCHHLGGEETSAKNPECNFCEGVSCEACHGPAEKWRTVHYLDYWKTTTREKKNELGMCSTEDLVFRAEQCALCHVGSAEFSVNHDLLAAGHPRLNFELAAYQQIMPKHWTKKENEAKIWALGQVVSTRAALRLLAHRADAKNNLPWPEFAEHDCYACHHDFQEPSWRQQSAYRKQIGNLRANDWYLAAVVPALATQVPAGDLKGLVDDIQAIRAEMKKSDPSRQTARENAENAARHLDMWIGRLKDAQYDDPESLQQWMQRILRESSGSSEPSWDQAAQEYLGIAALYYAKQDLVPGVKDMELDMAIPELVWPLKFPPEFDGPKSFDPKRWQETKNRLANRIH
jgi:hypothetical protein